MAQQIKSGGKHKRLLTRTELVQWYSANDNSIRCRRFSLGRSVLYFKAILDPDRWFYYPQDIPATIAAYSNRHKPSKLSDYDPRVGRGTYKYIKKFVRHPRKYTRQQYVDRIVDNTKRAIYQGVCDDLEKGSGYDSRVQPFVKLEKMRTTKYKAPRMIQARDVSFNIEYGVYIKAIEDKLKHDIHFGKGNYLDIGSKIRKLAVKYRYYTEADHSCFDAHITVEQLKVTHTFYQSCFNHDVTLRNLSKKTIVNRCGSRLGIKYKIKGTRMSGDVDTSLGNSLINYGMIMDVLHRLNIKGDAIVNGDDSIIFSDAPIPINEAARLFRLHNQETKLKNSVTNIHKVEFCRTKVVVNSMGQWTLMIDPKRLFDIFGMTYKTTGDYVKYLKQVIACNVACNAANPLFGTWLKLYTNVFGKVSLKEIMDHVYSAVEKKHRSIATRNLIQEPDHGTFNTTMYQAHGNLDYIDDTINTLTNRIKKILTLGHTKITTETLKSQPLTTTIIVDHNNARFLTISH
uniref:RNA-directed RNA polymerase n=1 Tax=Cushing virus TaxID=2600346 RepID=A0A5B8XAK8_9TOMB|nr:hypothetical protein 1 [Cushing virus]